MCVCFGCEFAASVGITSHGDVPEICLLAVIHTHPDYEGPPLFDTALEEEQPPEAHLHGDTGPALILRRNFLAPRSPDQPQRHAIFSSTCTIADKVCHFIIDSGACENVVASDAVAKLALQTEAHPSLYALMWLQKGNTITVDRRVLITFSIGGSYCDSVWCDVVPMDACHLLLGRP